jgi:hypothetical protein
VNRNALHAAGGLASNGEDNFHVTISYAMLASTVLYVHTQNLLRPTRVI